MHAANQFALSCGMFLLLGLVTGRQYHLKLVKMPSKLVKYISRVLYVLTVFLAALGAVYFFWFYIIFDDLSALFPLYLYIFGFLFSLSCCTLYEQIRSCIASLHLACVDVVLYFSP